jgi:hypothetical protein
MRSCVEITTLGGIQEETNLVDLIEATMNARSPEELELALARVLRHPDLDEAERVDFHNAWEALSDTLLQRWLDLRRNLDDIAYAALHRRNALPLREKDKAGS